MTVFPDYLPPGEVPNAPPFVPPPAPLLPELLPPPPPAYNLNLAPLPEPGFRERLGAALAGVQMGQPTAGDTGLSAFGKGLLGGAAHGFSGSTAMSAERATKNVERENTVRKAEADRNYANAQETWKAKLARHYKTEADKQGKIRLTPRMAADMGIPYEAGKHVDPLEASRAISQRTTSQRQPAPRREPVPKPPKTVPPAEVRRKYVVDIVAALRNKGLNTAEAVEGYLNTPGVADTLASHGILPSEVRGQFVREP